MFLAVRISSYGCTWEVWRALKKLELLSTIASSNSYASFVLSKLPACIPMRTLERVSEEGVISLPVICGKFKQFNNLQIRLHLAVSLVFHKMQSKKVPKQSKKRKKKSCLCVTSCASFDHIEPLVVWTAQALIG